MGKEFTNSDDVETEKQWFHPSERSVPIDYLHINNIVISEELPSTKKEF